ncbi:MAG: helix-turn-helix domain-containing protein [Methylococcaceae bacterium]
MNAPRTRRAKSQSSKIDGNSSAAQRQRLLTALRKGPITTLQARKKLDILHPAGRVQELRKEHYNIVTHWLTVYTTGRRKHRVARYVLFSGKGGAT